MSFEMDELDLQILRFLQRDARRPFLEIARELNVSGGTIHARVNKLRDEGIVRGARIDLDHDRLGFSVAAFIGVRLVKAKDCREIQDRFKAMPEVVEVHYTTGTYSLLVKVIVKNMRALHELLADKMQNLDEIQSTETFVVLNTTVDRDLKL